MFSNGRSSSWRRRNADLEPELLIAPAARRMLAAYAKAEKLAAYGERITDGPEC